ncbi:MAG TPA: ABC transporter ATP-binding protein [Anaerolineaceae bacterium]|mgnify:CR=1 FL=1|nr:ABC transporter ATP-binding protein [Anaerolineaceae bacterium]
MAYLELRNIHKSFGNVTAVNNFNLDIEKGKLVSFLGPSGCGKTTTLRMIAGFEQPDEGTIRLGNQDITVISPNQRDIGMVFQAYALFPNMNVRQNIAFGLKMKKTPKAEIEKRVDEVLEMVRLKDTAKRFPHQLSGGQQQRIALARALAVRPRVLLLDEPLSALDAEVRVALRGEIRRIQSDLAITTVYVTHDQEEALSISDQVVVMNNGIIQQVGTPEEIYRSPATRFVATFIGTANQFFGNVAGECKVQSNGLTITTRKLSDFSSGQKVVVLVRPELIIVSNAQPDTNSGNTIPGMVETITFHGAVTRLGVHVNQQRVVADITMTSSGYISLNQKVWLSFKPDACKVMAVDE